MRSCKRLRWSVNAMRASRHNFGPGGFALKSHCLARQINITKQLGKAKSENFSEDKQELEAVVVTMPCSRCQCMLLMMATVKYHGRSDWTTMGSCQWFSYHLPTPMPATVCPLELLLYYNLYLYYYYIWYYMTNYNYILTFLAGCRDAAEPRHVLIIDVCCFWLL